jgi:2,5-diamino-6-(ribosylamino)-4(3H)-pyrimidinone 5'-phosphate reductase
MNSPITTLFMLESLDGKINSGNSDSLDVDRDWKQIDGLREGLQQYYDLESETDLFSFNTGRVMAKIGVNERTEKPEKMEAVTFVIGDSVQVTEIFKNVNSAAVLHATDTRTRSLWPGVVAEGIAP